MTDEVEYGGCVILGATHREIELFAAQDRMPTLWTMWLVCTAFGERGVPLASHTSERPRVYVAANPALMKTAMRVLNEIPEVRGPRQGLLLQAAKEDWKV